MVGRSDGNIAATLVADGLTGNRVPFVNSTTLPVMVIPPEGPLRLSTSN